MKKKVAGRAHKKVAAPAPSAGAEDVACFYEQVLAANVDPPSGEIFVSSERPVTVSNDAASRAIRSGISAKAVSKAAKGAFVEKAKLLRAIGIDKSTLRRREHAKQPLDDAHAAGFVRTMGLLTLAAQTFGTAEKAGEWLAKPHPLLEGESPLEFARNEFALGKVKGMLLAIRYGGVV